MTRSTVRARDMCGMTRIRVSPGGELSQVEADFEPSAVIVCKTVGLAYCYRHRYLAILRLRSVSTDRQRSMKNYGHSHQPLADAWAAVSAPCRDRSPADAPYLT